MDTAMKKTLRLCVLLNNVNWKRVILLEWKEFWRNNGVESLLEQPTNQPTNQATKQ